MIVGLHNFTDAVVRYKDEVASSDGGLWIIALDAILLIPLMMAVFFYPVPALIGFAILGAITVVGLVVARRLHLGERPPDR